jgi:hypothetical protein
MAQAWRLITRTIHENLGGDPKNLSAKNFCFKVDFGAGTNWFVMVGVWYLFGSSWYING